ncbi:MAG: hypothetical protein IMZ53_12945 [Thermoplasmata archaeon]|nr:hypothetical protein [Thermoplasmata archaeon]
MEQEKKKEEIPERIIYKIEGMFWEQKPLLFKHDAKVLEMLEQAQKESNIDFSGGIMAVLSEVVRLPLIPDLIKIVLKPYTPNLQTRISNFYYRIKNKVSVKNPANSMNNLQVREVLRDFFYFNVSLFVNSSGLGDILDLMNKNQVVRKEPITSQSTTSQTDSSGEKSPS